MRIQLLKKGDETALIAAAREFNEIAMPRARATELLADPAFVMVVAETESGELMGRIYGHVISRLDQSDLFLYEVDVVDAHRQKGTGRAMLEFLKDYCRQRKYGEMFVLTECDNIAGNALYLSAGAVAEGSPANVYVYFPPFQ
jgi:GNAT superfamily N-acetyltransferase